MKGPRLCEVLGAVEQLGPPIVMSPGPGPWQEPGDERRRHKSRPCRCPRRGPCRCIRHRAVLPLGEEPQCASVADVLSKPCPRWPTAVARLCRRPSTPAAEGHPFLCGQLLTIATNDSRLLDGRGGEFAFEASWSPLAPWAQIAVQGPWRRHRGDFRAWARPRPRDRPASCPGAPHFQRSRSRARKRARRRGPDTFREAIGGARP